MPADCRFQGNSARELLDGITRIAWEAAVAILQVDRGTCAPRQKGDGSPVTAADEAAQRVIAAGLSQLLPAIPIVSEEMEIDRTIAASSMFALVDPLDGTKEYLAGRVEFTVNIAVIHAGEPFLGCIAAPALGLSWRGITGQFAERVEFSPGARAAFSATKIRTRRMRSDQPTVMVSRSHFDARTERFIKMFPRREVVECGSSLKFCRVAEGRADLYPRLAPTHEWDVAAGHAIVAAAGGIILKPDATPVTYGRFEEELRLPGFVVFGDSDFARRILPLDLP
jgi:3'(2'), 5'-bisphosphate nucleotidase